MATCWSVPRACQYVESCIYWNSARSRIWVRVNKKTLTALKLVGRPVQVFMVTTNARLFTYWINGAYQATGCGNLLCSGFIRINSEIAMGASISLVSTLSNSQIRHQYTCLKVQGTKFDAPQCFHSVVLTGLSYPWMRARSDYPSIGMACLPVSLKGSQ